MQMTTSQILVFSEPKRFEPMLLEHDRDFNWLAEMMKKVGEEKGDLMLAVIKKEISSPHAEIHEYFAQIVLRWDGELWKSVFGVNFRQVWGLLAEVQSAQED